MCRPTQTFSGLLFAAYFILSLILAPQYTQAQLKMLPGYIITNQGDTLHGFLRFKGTQKNPKHIAFAATATASDVKTFTAADIREFCVTAPEYYRFRSYIGPISTNRNDIGSLQWAQDRFFTNKIPVKKDSIFLRELLRGRLSLYEYADYKYRFFIQEDADTLIELYNVFYMVHSGSADYQYNDKLYQQQLKDVFTHNGTPLAPSRMDRIEYRDKSLIKAIREVNGSTPGTATTTTTAAATTTTKLSAASPASPDQAAASHPRWHHFGLGGGMQTSTLTYHYSNYPTQSTPSTYTGFVLSAFYEVSLNHAQDNQYVRLQLQWVPFDYRNSELFNNPAYINTQFSGHFLQFKPSYHYNIVNWNLIRLYAGAGENLNTSFVTNNSIDGTSTNLVTGPKVWLNTDFHLGLLIARHLDLNASYQHFGNPAYVLQDLYTSYTPFTFTAHLYW